VAEEVEVGLVSVVGICIPTRVSLLGSRLRWGGRGGDTLGGGGGEGGA